MQLVACYCSILPKISCSLDPVLWMLTPRYVNDSTIFTLSPATGTRVLGEKEASVVWILVINQLTWRPRDLALWLIISSANTSTDSISVVVLGTLFYALHVTYELLVGNFEKKIYVAIVVICSVACLCVVSNWKMFRSRQWTSFLAGASTAGYVYIYSFYYYFFKTKSASSDILFFDFVIWCMLYSHHIISLSIRLSQCEHYKNNWIYRQLFCQYFC